jgi:hypothetical protein
MRVLIALLVALRANPQPTKAHLTKAPYANKALCSLLSSKHIAHLAYLNRLVAITNLDAAFLHHSMSVVVVKYSAIEMRKSCRVE